MTAGDRLYSDAYLQQKKRAEEEFLRQPQVVAGAADAFNFFYVSVENDQLSLASEDFFCPSAKERRAAAAEIEDMCYRQS